MRADVPVAIVEPFRRRMATTLESVQRMFAPLRTQMDAMAERHRARAAEALAALEFLVQSELRTRNAPRKGCTRATTGARRARARQRPRRTRSGDPPDGPPAYAQPPRPDGDRHRGGDFDESLSQRPKRMEATAARAPRQRPVSARAV